MITDDPLFLGYGGRELYVDLGAERQTLAAEKDGLRIAVEIKSFVHRSAVYDLEIALGQYQLYEWVLFELEPKRQLYLAIPQHIYEIFF